VPSEVMVWDIETVPDLEGYARAHNLTGRSQEGIRSAMGDDFPKLIYHSIICIGALIASRTANGYEVQVVGAPHVGQRTEKELIESFVNKVAQVSPQLVSFNGCAFDLPVLRYRAMVHQVFAPGMHNKAYFHRYTDDNVDLCDVLSSFSYGGKVKLDELSRIMGLPGKPGGMDGSQVEASTCSARSCKRHKARRPANRASQQVLVGGEPQDGKAGRDRRSSKRVLTLADEVIE
jgi:predicted PolB exonuclease-like 3'-5' exonuclease